MSMNYSLHIGPYVRCENPKVSKTERRRSCPKTDCPKHEKDFETETKFCPKCGSQLAKIDVKVKGDRIGNNALDDDFHDRLSTVAGESVDKGYDLWVANQSYPGQIEWEADDQYFMGEEELDLSLPPKEKAAFEKFYAKELEKLRKVYGAENVTVKWGFCGTYG